MRVVEEMINCAAQLLEWGINALLPDQDEVVVNSTLAAGDRPAEKARLIRQHLEKIRVSDGVLIYNQTIDDRIDYIGANAFLEMGFAFAFGKPIYLLNDIPEQPNSEEIAGMLPVSLNGDLSAIRS